MKAQQLQTILDCVCMIGSGLLLSPFYTNTANIADKWGRILQIILSIGI